MCLFFYKYYKLLLRSIEVRIDGSARKMKHAPHLARIASSRAPTTRVHTNQTTTATGTTTPFFSSSSSLLLQEDWRPTPRTATNTSSGKLLSVTMQENTGANEYDRPMRPLCRWVIRTTTASVIIINVNVNISFYHARTRKRTHTLSLCSLCSLCSLLSLCLPPSLYRMVTSSSAAVGWMATDESKSALVAPIFIATPNPCKISSHLF